MVFAHNIYAGNVVLLIFFEINNCFNKIGSYTNYTNIDRDWFNLLDISYLQYTVYTTTTQ